jgi:hypothetical protein
MARMASSRRCRSSSGTAASMSLVCPADRASSRATTERPVAVNRMTCLRPSAAERCLVMSLSEVNLPRMRLR